MRIEVEEIPDYGRSLQGTTPVDLGAHDDESGLSADPVRYDLQLERFGSTVTIKGNIETAVAAACSRCAAAFEIPVQREFEAVFVTADVGEADHAVELDESDLDLDYYEGGAIDGLRLLAEQIFLELPMKVLCAEDCKGLCSQCGANLNQTTCDCEPQTDPRLASLQALRDQL